MNENSSFIQSHRQLIIDTLSPLINHDYVLLDIPNHKNIGDNLIWEGELVFLKNLPFKCHYMANVNNADLTKIPEKCVILLHGGGNWGDLYRECQEFRLKIVQRFPNNRIIVFPQSVCYKDSSLCRLDSLIFNAHTDIHICVRDKHSYEQLALYIDKSKLLMLPDMAFMLSIGFNGCHKTTKKNLVLARTDFENRKDTDLRTDFKGSNIDIRDWPTFYNSHVLSMLDNIVTSYKIKLSVFFQKTIFSFLVDPIYGLNFFANRQKYIKMGINFIKKYDVIYTTRLHGLILSILMGKKVVIIDNRYGKCYDYYITWLRDYKNITLYK